MILSCTLAWVTIAAPVAWSASFTTFESGQVRPLAMSPDGTKLFAVNTPDARLEIFDVTSGVPVHTGSVPVGLEPVAVAARTNLEIWVVNHLSDDISIVRLDAPGPRVTQTITTADEPRDIVVAAGGSRVFVTTAARDWSGNKGIPLAPNIGHALVYVYSIAPSGLIQSVVTRLLFTDTPRALAVSPDGLTVYAAGFHTGNQTTSVSEGSVCDGGGAVGPCTHDGIDTIPGGVPAPNANVQGTAAPEVGLILQYDQASGHWEDELARNWDQIVKFSLPDTDVFPINATTITVGTPIAHVGTILYNMVTNPVSGKLYVSNTEARNADRFEGPGVLAGHSVRGHLHESRITIVDGGVATPRHLNKHIDYGVVPSPPGVKEKSLALPMGMAVSSDGTTLYVAAMGSNVIGVFATAELENDTFVPDAADHLPVSGGGPTGLVLDEAHQRLYVLTRFNNAVATLDTATGAELDSTALHNPEPANVVTGRHFLYDATLTTSNGESPCGSCHVFGDFDSLAWDLGNPDGLVENNTNPFRVNNPFNSNPPKFHPMKGPMTTQSLRGMANHGPLHWRGDRRRIGGALDVEGAFKAFNVAFDGLLGRGGPLTDTEMQQFTDFILDVTYPPNPLRALDDSLTDSEARGRDIFFNRSPIDTFQTCNGCHRLDPEHGHFGTDGESSFDVEPQEFKIPHLRNLYQKVGMSGMAYSFFIDQGDNGFKGPQVRGFGFTHDGSVDTLFRFMHAIAFDERPAPFFNVGFPFSPEGDQMRRDVVDFLLAFDSNLKPIVGVQVASYNAFPDNQVVSVDLLYDRASAGDCDLIVKSVDGMGRPRGWWRAGNGFRSDSVTEPALSLPKLRLLADNTRPQIFTCVPPGSGYRMGIDRDEDGIYDFDEILHGTDPASPDGVQPMPAAKVTIKNRLPDDEIKNQISVKMKSATLPIPPLGSVSDPRCGDDPEGTVKATFTVSSPTSGATHTSPLPCQNWSLVGSTDDPQGYKYADKLLTAGTVSKLSWKRGKDMKATFTGKGASLLDYDLQPGIAQNPVRGRLVSGAVGVCFECTGSRDGSDGKSFAAKSCPAPPTCP
jgi:DNA-binding beta-propeller fold protein YncE